MKRRYITNIILTLGVLLLVLIFCFNQKESNRDRVTFNEQRKFREIRLKDTIPLKSAGTEIAVIDSHIFLLDQGNQEIKKYDLAGNLKDIYSKRGDGPNENQKIFHYDVDNRFVYTFDSGKQSFNKIAFF